jgi:tetratricopeptide (TPR) repeat protein
MSINSIITGEIYRTIQNSLDFAIDSELAKPDRKLAASTAKALCDILLNNNENIDKDGKYVLKNAKNLSEFISEDIMFDPENPSPHFLRLVAVEFGSIYNDTKKSNRVMWKTAVNNLSAVYLRLGRNSEAESNLTALLKNDKNHTSARRNRAIARARQGKIGNAVRDLKHLIQEDEVDQVENNYLAGCILAMRRDKKAIEYFRKSTSSRDDTKNNKSFGWMYMSLSNFDKAQYNFYSVGHLIGLAAKEMITGARHGINERAVRHLTSRLEHDPEDVQAHTLLGDCYIWKDNDKATEHYKKTIALVQDKVDNGEAKVIDLIMGVRAEQRLYLPDNHSFDSILVEKGLIDDSMVALLAERGPEWFVEANVNQMIIDNIYTSNNAQFDYKNLELTFNK